MRARVSRVRVEADDGSGLGRVERARAKAELGVLDRNGAGQ